MLKLCGSCLTMHYPDMAAGLGYQLCSPKFCDRCNSSSPVWGFKATPDSIPFLGAPLAPIPHETAVKADNGKPKLSLLTRESLIAEARALEYGARKYDKNNYKKGMEWSRVIDAAYRHLAAFNAKELVDTESGLSHLDHLKACVAMLVYYEANKIGTDDR